MNYKLIWILYNLICLILAFMVIKGTNDKSFKLVGLIFVLTFSILLTVHFGVKGISSGATIAVTVGYLIFAIKTLRATMKFTDKLFLLILPTVTIIKLYFEALHFVYYNEIKFISILILIITIGFYLVERFIKKYGQRLREEFEINGLFGVILLSTLIY